MTRRVEVLWAFGLLAAGVGAHAPPAAAEGAPAPGDGSSAGTAPIAPVAAPEGGPRGSTAARLENDFFGTTDQYYTHGLALSWTGVLADGDRVPGAGLLWLDARLAQAMYTPRTIWVEEPPADDRPYAGVLTGRVGLVALSDTRCSGIGLTAGVVGPGSGADRSQELFHEVFRIRRPRGWDTQLSNRALVALDLEHADVFDRRVGERSAFALMSYGQLHLGTVQRTTTFGGGIHIGYQLDPRASLGLVSSVLGAPPSDEEGRAGFGILVAGLGRVVGYDGLIEGAKQKNTRPDARRTVAEARIGAVVRLGAVRIRYAQVVESRSFESQPGRHIYGEAELSVAY